MTVDYTRRKLLRTAATGGAALAVAANAAPSSAQAPVRRPNIVFILADDMGYADISCYGRRDLVTLPLARGTSALVLSVSAAMPGGQTSTQTDRLEFVRR